jgi:hypothetical protein
VLAVDFKGVERLVPARVTGRFKRGQRAVAKRARKAQASSIPTFSTLPVRLCLRFFDEGFGHGVDFVDPAVEPEGGVDAMGQQIARDAAAGDLERPGATGPRRPGAIRG